jgi:4-aminobutyrate aminotransferase/(S)-3-amino-2-methylpropionate transaminase
MPNTMTKTESLLAERERHVARGVLTAHPLVIARGEGAHVFDADGKSYLDFVGGIGVMNVGHNHPRVVEAVSDQLSAITHTAFQVAGHEPYIALAARLNTLVGQGKDFKSVFFTTGAEAVENAVKIARAHTGRSGILAFRGAFHGRTLLGMTLTGMSEPYRQNFGPFAPDIHHVPFPDAYRGVTSAMALDALGELFATEAAADRIAAIIIEPVQGDGGFRPAPPEFLRALRALATRHGIVLICDEIQTGFGRTGKMFAFEHAGIEPDLVTLAKSLAGGFPLSGVTGKATIMDAPLPGGLGGTYGGNAVACAAALAVLDAFEQDGLIEQGAARAAQMREDLERLQRRHACIGDVRGLGFMLALEFVTDRQTKTPDAELTQRVIDTARQLGLLVIKCGINRNVLRFLAPLVASRSDVAEALAIIETAITKSTATVKAA